MLRAMQPPLSKFDIWHWSAMLNDAMPCQSRGKLFASHAAGVPLPLPSIQPPSQGPSAPATPTAPSPSVSSPSPTALDTLPTAGGSDAMQQLFREWGVAASQSPSDSSALNMIGEAIRQATGDATAVATAVAGALLQGQAQQQQQQQQQQAAGAVAGTAVGAGGVAGFALEEEVRVKPAVDVSAAHGWPVCSCRVQLWLLRLRSSSRTRHQTTCSKELCSFETVTAHWVLRLGLPQHLVQCA